MPTYSIPVQIRNLFGHRWVIRVTRTEYTATCGDVVVRGTDDVRAFRIALADAASALARSASV